MLEAAMRHVDEAVLITTAELDSPDPKVVYVNEGFCQMTGFTADGIVGRTPRSCKAPILIGRGSTGCAGSYPEEALRRHQPDQLPWFKDVNDSSGRHAGDRLLVEVAGRPTELLTLGVTVARFGGDEVAMLLENPSEGDEATGAAERIIGASDEPFVVTGRVAFVSASVGIRSLSVSSDGPDELLRDTDVATYRAKWEARVAIGYREYIYQTVRVGLRRGVRPKWCLESTPRAGGSEMKMSTL